MTYEQLLTLFDRMRSDMGVMAEWADDERGLWEELTTADDEILGIYWDTFCE